MRTAIRNRNDDPEAVLQLLSRSDGHSQTHSDLLKYIIANNHNLDQVSSAMNLS